MKGNCSQLSCLITKITATNISGGVCEGSVVQCSKYFVLSLNWHSTLTIDAVMSVVWGRHLVAWKMKSELVEKQSIEQLSSHPILLVNNSLALTEHRLSDPSALDIADWSAMRMLTDLLIINCSLSSCKGKGNIYLRSLFKKRYMYIHRKRNKNTSKSSDLKKTTFRAFDSRHLHIRKNVLDDANW